MHNNTTIAFRSIDGLGPTAWCRGDAPVKIHRTKHDRRKRKISESLRTADPSPIDTVYAGHKTKDTAA